MPGTFESSATDPAAILGGVFGFVTPGVHPPRGIPGGVVWLLDPMVLLPLALGGALVVGALGCLCSRASASPRAGQRRTVRKAGVPQAVGHSPMYARTTGTNVARQPSGLGTRADDGSAAV
uniref:Uncharacterized protein n=1 Tax=Haptolina ericina TaxID=156174 RepID=A0A7S3F9G2_9EUKA